MKFLKHAVHFKLLAVMILFIVHPVTEIFSQTKEIYINPEFSALAKDHQVLAILPFEVVINLRPKEKEKLKPGDLETMQKKEGDAVQSALETYFLKQKEKEVFKVRFQDVSKTNTLLLKNSWTADSLKTKTKEELAAYLEVDGIISGSLFTDKPMSESAAVISFIFGFWVPTNSGKCTINVHNAKDGELLWKYEKTLSRGMGSDIQTVINNMMRKASRKFPYEEIKN